jgi:hypothetical protein
MKLEFWNNMLQKKRNNNIENSFGRKVVLRKPDKKADEKLSW